MSVFKRSLIASFALVGAIALAGCSATTATPTGAATDSSSSQAGSPAVAPTTAQTTGPNLSVSLIDEKGFLAVMKPLAFECDASVIKAIEFSGTQIEFSSIACRRGAEPDVILTLAADQNELELVTLQSCKAVTGTQNRTPIVAGGNWQMLSAGSDGPLLEQLAKVLQGKLMTIAELCV